MDTLWVNKYKPTDTTIFGRIEEQDIISKWLLEDKKKYFSLLILGTYGCGKKSILNVLLHKNNYNKIIINPSEIKNYRVNDTFKDIFNFKYLLNKKKNIIIFNNIDIITLSSDKKYLLQLIKQNNKLKKIPIILISNNKHNKLILDIKKQTTFLYFNTMNKNDILLFIKYICIKENIKISKSILEKIIINTKYDIKKLLNLLQNISYNYKIINKENYNNFINYTRNKNTDCNLIDDTYNIINNKLDDNTIFKLYENEKVLLPLTIHENYIKKVLSNKNINKLDYLCNINESISISDIIETNIYSNQNWFLKDIHCYYSCIYTNNELNKIDNNVSNINFSQDLNKTSLKNINKKNIKLLREFIGNKSINELLLINKLSHNMIKENKFNDIINIIKKYNNTISYKDLELLNKIDKTQDYKLFNITQKNLIKNILE
jgi:DNA polymerase III delta prime subunit